MIEKVYLPKQARTVKDEDGTERTEIVEPWEIRATGKDCQELRGIFKDSAPQMMHESWKEWQKYGTETITKPDGSIDTCRADRLDRYRAKKGFCERAIRPTFTMNGFGGMKREGITRMRIRYSKGERTVEEVR